MSTKVTFCLGLALVFASSEISAKDRLYKVDAKRDTTIAGVAALGAVVPYLFADKIISRRCPCPSSEVNGFDRPAIGRSSDLASVLSDGFLSASFFSAVVIDGLQTDWESEFLDDMLVLAQAFAISSALTSITKHVTQRPRPDTYALQSDLNDPSSYRSFFSGHASSAFTFLGFMAYTSHRRNWGGAWPWIGLGIGGTAVGLARVEAGKHFYSDIIVGALVGSACGILIPYLHAETGSSALILPVINEHEQRLVVSVSW